MKIGLLDTVPQSYWPTDSGITESEKFIDFLMPVMKGTRFDQFFVAEGKWPARIDDYDAYLITGSPCSVNEGYVWIEKLKNFVRNCLISQKKIVGICFGHQLIASALGGKVERRRDGWLLGVKSFEIVDVQSWMIPPKKRCEIHHINQDHVTSLPENAKRIAYSGYCKNSAFVVGDTVVGLQGHPEQPRRAMENFIKELLLLGADQEEMKRGRDSLMDDLPDADLWRNWIGKFLEY